MVAAPDDREFWVFGFHGSRHIEPVPDLVAGHATHRKEQGIAACSKDLFGIIRIHNRTEYSHVVVIRNHPRNRKKGEWRIDKRDFCGCCGMFFDVSHRQWVE